jgi:hypothetical protein
MFIISEHFVNRKRQDASPLVDVQKECLSGCIVSLEVKKK